MESTRITSHCEWSASSSQSAASLPMERSVIHYFAREKKSNAVAQGAAGSLLFSAFCIVFEVHAE
jgi:hypothetical protein